MPRRAKGAYSAEVPRSWRWRVLLLPLALRLTACTEPNDPAQDAPDDGADNAGAVGGSTTRSAGGGGGETEPSGGATTQGNAGSSAAGPPPGPDAGVVTGDPPAAADASIPSLPARPPDLQHTFVDITVAAGEEQDGVCQSWTIGNAEPFFVNRVVASNQGAFHHSNWIWVHEADYDGPDGTWPCAERGFDQILAAAGGGVFFAQSTQSRTDTQAFPENVAFEVPAHARLIGDVHMLNPSDAPVTSNLHFDVYTLEGSQVEVKLQPMAFTNNALEIVPGMKTQARMQCAMPQPDFDVYYVLPHYHGNGRALRVDVAGGPRGGMSVFGGGGVYGEALGATFDPPLAVSGAEGLIITCDYENLGSAVLGYGTGGQEMCVVLIYSTGAKAGGMGVSALTAMDVAGVHQTDALCVAVSVP